MECCRVKTFIAGDGEEMNVLLDANGAPAYWPNLYATQKLRSAGLSPKTILSILRSIGMATNWMAPSGLDFSERMVHGDPLLFEEAISLADFLALSVRSQGDWLKIEYARASKGSSPRAAVIRLESVRPSHRAAVKDPRDYLNSATAATNMRSVASYLEWIYGLRKHPNRIADYDPERQIFAKEGLDQFRKRIPRVKGASDDDETLWALEFDHCRIIESIVLPHSAQNPWQSPFIRDRNYLIWRLFLETGARRGEIHNIKVSDFDLSKYSVTLRISKTIPRTVSYKRATSALVHEYIEANWQHLPIKARRAGYLITSRGGDRLSERSMNLIFETIRKASPDIPDWLTPHTMRRTWNEELSRKIDAMTGDNKWTEEQEKKVRKRLMGWSIHSNMADKYLRRHTRRKADEINQKLFESSETISNSRQELGHVDGD